MYPNCDIKQGQNISGILKREPYKTIFSFKGEDNQCLLLSEKVGRAAQKIGYEVKDADVLKVLQKYRIDTQGLTNGDFERCQNRNQIINDLMLLQLHEKGVTELKEADLKLIQMRLNLVKIEGEITDEVIDELEKQDVYDGVPSISGAKVSKTTVILQNLLLLGRNIPKDDEYLELLRSQKIARYYKLNYMTLPAFTAAFLTLHPNGIKGTKSDYSGKYSNNSNILSFLFEISQYRIDDLCDILKTSDELFTKEILYCFFKEESRELWYGLSDSDKRHLMNISELQKKAHEIVESNPRLRKMFIYFHLGKCYRDEKGKLKGDMTEFPGEISSLFTAWDPYTIEDFEYLMGMESLLYYKQYTLDRTEAALRRIVDMEGCDHLALLEAISREYAEFYKIPKPRFGVKDETRPRALEDYSKMVERMLEIVSQKMHKSERAPNISGLLGWYPEQESFPISLAFVKKMLEGEVVVDDKFILEIAKYAALTCNKEILKYLIENYRELLKNSEFTFRDFVVQEELLKAVDGPRNTVLHGEIKLLEDGARATLLHAACLNGSKVDPEIIEMLDSLNPEWKYVKMQKFYFYQSYHGDVVGCGKSDIPLITMFEELSWSKSSGTVIRALLPDEYDEELLKRAFDDRKLGSTCYTRHYREEEERYALLADVLTEFAVKYRPQTVLGLIESKHLNICRDEVPYLQRENLNYFLRVIYECKEFKTDEVRLSVWEKLLNRGEKQPINRIDFLIAVENDTEGVAELLRRKDFFDKIKIPEGKGEVLTTLYTINKLFDKYEDVLKDSQGFAQYFDSIASSMAKICDNPRDGDTFNGIKFLKSPQDIWDALALKFISKGCNSNILLKSSPGKEDELTQLSCEEGDLWQQSLSVKSAVQAVAGLIPTFSGSVKSAVQAVAGLIPPFSGSVKSAVQPRVDDEIQAAQARFDEAQAKFEKAKAEADKFRAEADKLGARADKVGKYAALAVCATAAFVSIAIACDIIYSDVAVEKIVSLCGSSAIFGAAAVMYLER